MTNPIRRALLQDAFYQVLDNKIFRVLVAIVLLLIAATFAVAFREEEIKLLFIWSVSYEDLFSSFGFPLEDPEGVREAFIQGLQEQIVTFVGGVLGVILCITATAFFVPRMLERGSADIVYSKPVSRLRLFLARYFAGLLFVSILAALLIFGVYVGLALVSGYNDPGFLWSALTLIYLFGLMHSVSAAAGVMTRSTVASILIAVLFFLGTGCIHQIWISVEHQKAMTSAVTEEDAADGDEAEEQAAADEEPEEDANPILDVLGFAFRGLHYVLPKTTDADFVSRKLMKTLTQPGRVVVDAEGKLTIRGHPADHTLTGGGGLDADLSEGAATWTLEEDGREVSRVEVSRSSRMVPPPPDSKRTRPRRLSLRRASDAQLAEITATGVAEEDVTQSVATVDGISGRSFTWTAEGQERRVAIFTWDVWLFRIDQTSDPGWLSRAEREAALTGFFDNFEMWRDPSSMDPGTWYDSRFDWDAPLKFNILFSLGSSLAFALAMLLIGWWKLSRIDF